MVTLSLGSYLGQFQIVYLGHIACLCVRGEGRPVWLIYGKLHSVWLV
jgi:hypothetical protein